MKEIEKIKFVLKSDSPQFEWEGLFPETQLNLVKYLYARLASAKRLLLDLTPGGSEFHGSPERCAQWAQDRISFTGKLAAERNRLRTAADALAVGVDELLEMLEDDELTPESMLGPIRALLHEYRATK